MSQQQLSTPSASSSDSHIRHIDGLKSLDELCQEREAVLLAVVHNLSPRCQRFFPIYREIASSLSASGSVIQCAQAFSELALAEKLDFYASQLPAIFLCHRTQEHKRYRGPLRKDDILAFLARQDMPAVTDVGSSSNLDEIRKTHKTVVVAYMGEDDETLRGDFLSVAEEMSNDFVFCASTAPNLVAAEEVSIPSIVVYKHVPDEKSILGNPSSSEAIRVFVQDASRPLIAEFFPELQEDLLEEPIPLGYILLPADQANQPTSTLISSLLPVARKYRQHILLGAANDSLFPDLPSQIHLTTSSRPAFAIRSSPPQRARFPLNESGPATAASIKAHISAFLAGTLAEALKSAPVPSVQDNPVIEVVGKTYEAIVLDPSKDVLLEFYTPWCGPCKVLAPMYEELARCYNTVERGRDGDGDGRAMENGKGKGVVIARVDCENNDVPDRDVRGFPWFKLYPARMKDRPVRYEGDWTVEAWRAFVEREGSKE